MITTLPFYQMEDVLYTWWTLPNQKLAKERGTCNHIYLRTFPSSEGEKTNLQVGLTKFFLILLDEAGKIRLFHL